MAQFCGWCGQPLDEGARFCAACGNAVVPDQGPAAETVDPGAPAYPYVDPAAAPSPFADPTAQPRYPEPYAPIAPAPASPPRPLMSKKQAIVAAIVLGVAALGWLGWTVVAPLMTSPASIADQLVRAAMSNNDAAVRELVAPELGANTAYAVNGILDNATLTPAFQTSSQQGFTAVATLHTSQWAYVFTMTRPWNANWRVTRIEMTGSEIRSEAVPALTTTEYEEWDEWPSSEEEVLLTDAADGSRTFTWNMTRVNGVPGDGFESSSTVTVPPTAATAFRGTGPEFDPYDLPSYYSTYNNEENDTKRYLTITANVGSPYGSYDTTAPLRAKLECKVRTPDGEVVSSGVKTNDGVPDQDYSSYKTFTWGITPKFLHDKGATSHPTSQWLAGTYYVVFLADGEVVGISSWDQE